MILCDLFSEGIERMPASDYPGGENDMSVNPSDIKKSGPLPGIDGMYYGVGTKGGIVHIYAFNSSAKDRAVGELKMYRHTEGPLSGYRIASVTISEYYRGHGISTALYLVALRGFKSTIFADEIQTPGGRATWVKLSRTSGVQVKGWVMIYDSVFNASNRANVNKKNESLIDMVMNSGGEYIGEGDIGGKKTHYFAFNVRPGKGELEPEIKREIKLYYDQAHADTNTIDSGLYAQWTGSDTVSEGWKEKLAGAAVVAGALGAGYSSLPNQQEKPQPTPITTAVTNVVKKMTPVEVLRITATKAGIVGQELAQFLAQASHETMDFKHLQEIGSHQYFAKKYDPKFNPRKAKILGNTEIGDGIKYHGRGFLQITGRWNYAKAGKELGLPLEEHPELVERPDIAAKVAVWFWKHRVQPKVTDFGDVHQTTKKINPGMQGLKDRIAKFAHYSKEKGD